MNRTLPEMLLGLNSPEMSVLERQRAQMKWQFQSQLDLDRVVKTDPGHLDCLGFGALGYGNVPNSRNNAYLPADGGDGRDPSLPGKLKKRKAAADKIPSIKAIEEDGKQKRIKERAEEGDSKITQQNNIMNVEKNQNKNDNSPNDSKENSKITHVQKTDYIHVRARRGQATDSHSLAERVRREKISERMKYLQDLVPGCDKITGKAGMLDEIINYVQSLQRQVEFLSMKLATVTPTLDKIDNFFTKEMFLASSSNFADNSLTPDMIIPAAYQLNQLQQLVSNVTAPLSNPDTFLDSFLFSQIQPPLNFGPELQNFYGTEFQPGTTISYPLQTFTGSMEGGNLKMEM